MNKLPHRSDTKSSLPIIRIESLTDNKQNTLMVTVSGCYLNDDGMMVQYLSEEVPDMQEAERRVAKLRKQGFEFQLVKVSSTI